TIGGAELLDRLRMPAWPLLPQAREAAPFMRVLRDSRGVILGRATLPTSSLVLQATECVITVGGFRAGGVGRLMGIFVGSSFGASRQFASPPEDDYAFSTWASEQAMLFVEAPFDLRTRLFLAFMVVAFGGNPGELPLARLRGELVSRDFF